MRNLPLSNFYNVKNTPDGLSYWCIFCRDESKRKQKEERAKKQGKVIIDDQPKSWYEMVAAKQGLKRVKTFYGYELKPINEENL